MILLIVSIGGAIFVAIEKEGYLFDETRGRTQTIEYSQLLEGNHSYQVIFGASDESSGSDAVVRVPFILYIDDDEVLNSQLYARDGYEYDDNENPDARDSIRYYTTPSVNVNLTIVGEMGSGDDWYIKVYRDVPPSVDTKFILCGIVIVFGVVALLMGGYEEMKFRDDEQKRIDAQRSESQIQQRYSGNEEYEW